MNKNPTPEELQAALTRVIEGEAEPRDDALVAEMLRARPELREGLRQQLQLDAFLRLEAEPTAAAFVESVAARIQPPADDEAAFLGRVRAALPTGSRDGVNKRSLRGNWRSWRPLTAAAAGLMLAALIGGLIFSSLTQASAAAVVQRALKAHAALLDRCYRVEVRGGERAVPPRRQESLLWTRGDGFWNQIEADGKSMAWGRDEGGGVWFALSRKEGARLSADEVPEPLQTACDLRSVQMESLLREILAGYDLRREPASADIDLIHAEPKPGNTASRYGSALLEVDAHTHVLRRVELQRTHQGRAVATVSFTLVESSLQDDARYTLEGHLDPDGNIYDRASGRGQRGPVIAEFLRLIRAR